MQDQCALYINHFGPLHIVATVGFKNKKQFVLVSNHCKTIPYIIGFKSVIIILMMKHGPNNKTCKHIYFPLVPLDFPNTHPIRNV